MATILWCSLLVIGLAVNALLCFSNELFRICLLKCSIGHANTKRIEVNATYSMHHIGFHNAMQCWIHFLRWYFSHNDFVNAIWCSSACGLQPKQNVGMGQSMLLKFYRIQPSLNLPKGAILYNSISSLISDEAPERSSLVNHVILVHLH